MTVWSNIGAAFAMGSLILLSAPLSADLAYNFSTPTGNLGNTHVYTNNGVSITAHGFNNAGQTLDLWGKNDGGSEDGVGLAIDGDHEIGTNNFVQLDMANFWAANPSDMRMSIGSVQQSEGWSLYTSNTLGSLGSLLFSGTTDHPNTFAINPLPDSFRYLSVQASAFNVLLSTLTAKQVSVPEPTTILLLSSTLAMAIKRRRKQQQAMC